MSALLDEAQLAAWAALAEAATPGPWAYEHTGEGSWALGLVDPPMQGEITEDYDEATSTFSEKPEVVESVAENGVDGTMADARFIAEARTMVPALLAEVRELRARLATAQAVCDAAVEHEREECAQVAERWGNDDAADEIRARGGA